MRALSVLVLTFTFLCLCHDLLADDGYQRKKTHMKKDPRDYTDRDVDSLYDEWEVGSIFVCWVKRNLSRTMTRKSCPKTNVMMLTFAGRIDR